QRADGSNTKWYYVQNGKYTKLTGLAQRADGSNTKWYYVQNGKYTKLTGLAQRADRSNEVLYYVQNGLYTKATGIAQEIVKSSNNWYYVQNGKFAAANGIAQKADGSSTAWYYVDNGQYTKASGIAKKADGTDNTWYYVQNGKYTKSSGIAQRADGANTSWYYVQNGKLKTVSGIAQKADGSSRKWYYVKNGIFINATGISKKADRSSNTWYYVQNGVYTTKYSGPAPLAGVAGSDYYYVENGVFVNKTGEAYLNDCLYTLENGVIKSQKQNINKDVILNGIKSVTCPYNTLDDAVNGLIRIARANGFDFSKFYDDKMDYWAKDNKEFANGKSREYNCILSIMKQLSEGVTAEMQSYWVNYDQAAMDDGYIMGYLLACLTISYMGQGDSKYGYEYNADVYLHATPEDYLESGDQDRHTYGHHTYSGEIAPHYYIEDEDVDFANVYKYVAYALENHIDGIVELDGMVKQNTWQDGTSMGGYIDINDSSIIYKTSRFFSFELGDVGWWVVAKMPAGFLAYESEFFDWK
ncbi:MAG: hypothetical protein HUJ76_11020, partial [Parasporobacterium sp.]|nr:hypothetical protein [Parasporobacterium sp.]